MSSLSDHAVPDFRGSTRSWIFTLNNWTSDDWDSLVALGETDEITYLVAGREVGASGTPHLQGCVTFRKTKRRAGVSRLIPRAWIAKTKRLQAARKYCMKDDSDPLIVDNCKQGDRSDLSTAVEVLKQGGLTAVVDQCPETFVRNYAGLSALASRLMVPRDPGNPPEVWWIYGPTGVCKSRFVHERESDLWVSLGSHKWWQGYEQQPAILFDDMRASFAPFNELLKILDRYEYKAEVKGSHIQVNSSRIYITTQFPPATLYNRDNRSGEDIRQLYRRITRLVRVTTSMDDLYPGSNARLVHGNFHETLDSIQIERQIADSNPTSTFIPYDGTSSFGGGSFGRRTYR